MYTLYLSFVFSYSRQNRHAPCTLLTPLACKIQSSPVLSSSRMTEGSYVFLFPPPLLKRKTVDVKRQNANKSETANLLRYRWCYVESGANGEVFWLLYTGIAECGRNRRRVTWVVSVKMCNVFLLLDLVELMPKSQRLWQTSKTLLKSEKIVKPGNEWKSQSPPAAHWKSDSRQRAGFGRHKARSMDFRLPGI